MNRSWWLLLLFPWICSCDHSAKSQVTFDEEKAALKAATLEERPVTIHSKPVIRAGEDMTWLEASEGEIHVTELWAEAGKTPPVELDPAKIYQFDLLEQPYVTYHSPDDPEEFLWLASIVRILESGRVIYDASICPLHQISMERQMVPIQYGLPLYPEGFLAARKSRFAHAKPYVEGGCCIGSDKTSRVFRCTRCIEDQAAWKAANPRGQ